MSRTLTIAEIRWFYDWFGRLQDLQVLYEGRAVKAAVRLGRFDQARAVFELGCGTGLLARRLLQQHLSPAATYVGFDVSRTMVQLSRRRVAQWKDRAEIRLTNGSLELPFEPGTFDRFISAYTLDLMDEPSIETALREAHRVLEPGGLLCLASLTEGETGLARLFSRLWARIQAWQPVLTGGCRPLRLEPLLSAGPWRTLSRQIITQCGVTSEVCICERLDQTSISQTPPS